ncbi:MAG: 3-hydroxyacyl-CoA dehydrogenase [Marinosulfonomonas sp.]|nr:3-hydroxyacyl-CoA dehydrogenase [Marinosulfonomonas sp.]
MMDQSDSKTFGVIGAGIMGCGIAQIAAQAGMQVVLGDLDGAALEKAHANIAKLIRRLAEKGRISAADAEAAIARISTVQLDKAPGYAAFAPCNVVVEAVVERMDVKHSVLVSLEGEVSDDCIIATNTSSLSVTEFASAARLPERVAGYHFFNPVPLMKLVEVVAGVLTSPKTADRLVDIARDLGHMPVRATDTPGFLVNHAGRAFGPEGLRILTEGIADHADIDRVMTEAAGFRMGPFELFDLIGLDISHAVMESIYHQYHEEPRYRPAALVAPRRAAGLLGRKTGRGFYVYADGVKQVPAENPIPDLKDTGRPVWISSRHADLAATLKEYLATRGCEFDDAATPGPNSLIFLTPLGEDTTTAALAEGVDPKRAVAVDCLLPLERRLTLMHSPATDPDFLASACGILGGHGTAVTTIADSPGFIAQRVLAMIVNIGCDIAQQKIATPGDIDLAVERGLGYPEGPLKLGDRIGPARILEILDGLYAFYRDPRYRPSPWLIRRARLGLSLHHTGP